MELWQMIRKRPIFMDWEKYAGRIRFLSEHNFQQKTRRQNVKNLSIAEYLEVI